jgi:hypothetical protein
MAVPVCAVFSILAMALYGNQLLAQDKTLPGALCFAWFVVFSILCGSQCAYWLVVFIPARHSRDYFNSISNTSFGKLLKREAFYVAINKCQYAMLCCIAIEFLFLTVAQYALTDYGTLDQNFGLLMGVPCVIHLCIFAVRLLAWS